jgi:hypothetical protein
MIPQRYIALAKSILLAFAVSWFGAVSLGNIYGAIVGRTVNIADLWIMAIIPIATIVSSIIAIFMTPLTLWAMHGYASIKWFFGLWLLLIICMFLGFAARLYGLIIPGLLILSIGGLVGIRYIGSK